MPELPEVETIRLQLNEALKGLRITKIEVLNKKSFLGEVDAVKGAKVMEVRRRGKMILLGLEGKIWLAVHLKLTGQLIYREVQNYSSKFKVDGENGPFEVKDLPNKFTRVVITFDNGGKLYFNDLRMFGWMKVVRELGRLGENKLGPEANDEKEFTLEYFKNILGKAKKPVKLVLMDQEKLAGVGNIYANEALFMAGIMPTRRANELSEGEVNQLRNSILKVLNEAIQHKGSSDKDEAYRQITGEKGTHQNYLQIYGRAGQKCLRCGGVIKKLKLGGRGTFYCENCQR